MHNWACVSSFNLLSNALHNELNMFMEIARGMRHPGGWMASKSSFNNVPSKPSGQRCLKANSLSEYTLKPSVTGTNEQLDNPWPGRRSRASNARSLPSTSIRHGNQGVTFQPRHRSDQNSKEDYALIMELLGTPTMRRLMRQLRAQMRQEEAEASASARSSHNEVEPDPEAGHMPRGSNNTPTLTSPGSRVRSWVKRRLLSWQDSIRKRIRKDMYKSSEYDPEFHMQGYSSATNTTAVVAALIATLSFAALLQPPGGIRQEGSLGKANLAGNLDFKVFFIANGMALFVALLSILILTSVVPRSHRGAFVLYQQGKLLVWVATIFTVIAFIAAAYIVAGPGHRILAWLLLGGAVLLIIALFAIVGLVKLERKILRPMREHRRRKLRRSQGLKNPQNLLHGQEEIKG